MRKLIFAFTTLVIFVSCKKDETAPADTCKISSTTIAGTYKRTAIKYKASSSAAEVDSYVDECKKDDLYELKTDGSVVVGDGTEVCPGPPPPGSITAWSISADGKVFALDYLYDVQSFDCITLVVSYKDNFVPGDITTVNYVKQ